MPSSSAAERLQAASAMDTAEAKAAFYLRMRAQGVRDLRVLRAFELVPRAIFVPAQYRAFAARDIAIPIDCGQTLNETGLIARMIEALNVEPSHKVLQIGAGTGYATAILAQLAADVIALERRQSLAQAAQARLDQLAVGNAIVVWGDGLALPVDIGSFDRIIVHGVIDRPDALIDRLAPTGTIVCAMQAAGLAMITRLSRDETGAVAQDQRGSCRLQPLVPELASAF